MPYGSGARTERAAANPQQQQQQLLEGPEGQGTPKKSPGIEKYDGAGSAHAAIITPRVLNVD